MSASGSLANIVGKEVGKKTWPLKSGVEREDLFTSLSELSDRVAHCTEKFSYRFCIKGFMLSDIFI